MQKSPSKLVIFSSPVPAASQLRRPPASTYALSGPVAGRLHAPLVVAAGHGPALCLARRRSSRADDGSGGAPGGCPGSARDPVRNISYKARTNQWRLATRSPGPPPSRVTMALAVRTPSFQPRPASVSAPTSISFHDAATANVRPTPAPLSMPPPPRPSPRPPPPRATAMTPGPTPQPASVSTPVSISSLAVAAANAKPCAGTAVRASAASPFNEANSSSCYCRGAQSEAADGSSKPALSLSSAAGAAQAPGRAEGLHGEGAEGEGGDGEPRRVALVGTGLGDPELLTLKAVRAIEAADLVEASGRQRWEVVGAGEEKKANLEGPFCIYSCHVAPRQGVWT